MAKQNSLTIITRPAISLKGATAAAAGRAGGTVSVARKGQHWELFHLPAANRGAWMNFVLHHSDARYRKRNYWFGWNQQEQRLARKSDLAHLAKKFPEVYRWVEAVCRENWSAP